LTWRTVPVVAVTAPIAAAVCGQLFSRMGYDLSTEDVEIMHDAAKPLSLAQRSRVLRDGASRLLRMRRTYRAFSIFLILRSARPSRRRLRRLLRVNARLAVRDAAMRRLLTVRGRTLLIPYKSIILKRALRAHRRGDASPIR
jgi:hypothetical protein